MSAKPQATPTDRRLSLPEVHTIASVIVGNMAQHWSSHSGVATNVGFVNGQPSLQLILHSDESDYTEATAWLADVSRVTDTAVGPASKFGLASVYCRDWERTGVSVHALATVADRTAETFQ